MKSLCFAMGPHFVNSELKTVFTCSMSNISPLSSHNLFSGFVASNLTSLSQWSVDSPPLTAMESHSTSTSPQLKDHQPRTRLRFALKTNRASPLVGQSAFCSSVAHLMIFNHPFGFCSLLWTHDQKKWHFALKCLLQVVSC